MLIKISTLLPVVILLSVFAQPGSATLIGSSVTGSLTFSGDPSNYFDPGNYFVPAAGYLNSAGPTVTVSGSAVEFGYDDGADLISADFSANGLMVDELVEMSGTANGLQMMFTDPALAGQYLIPVSDTFPLADYSVSGDVITLDYAGGNPAVGQTLSASFTVAAVPEPSTLGLLLLSILVGATALLKRSTPARP